MTNLVGRSVTTVSQSAGATDGRPFLLLISSSLSLSFACSVSVVRSSLLFSSRSAPLSCRKEDKVTLRVTLPAPPSLSARKLGRRGRRLQIPESESFRRRPFLPHIVLARFLGSRRSPPFLPPLVTLASSPEHSNLPLQRQPQSTMELSSFLIMGDDGAVFFRPLLLTKMVTFSLWPTDFLGRDVVVGSWELLGSASE